MAASEFKILDVYLNELKGRRVNPDGSTANLIPLPFIASQDKNRIHFRVYEDGIIPFAFDASSDLELSIREEPAGQPLLVKSVTADFGTANWDPADAYTVIQVANASGTFEENNLVTESTSGATGYVWYYDSTNTQLILKNVTGTFTGGEVLTETKASGATGATADGSSPVIESHDRSLGTIACQVNFNTVELSDVMQGRDSLLTKWELAELFPNTTKRTIAQFDVLIMGTLFDEEAVITLNDLIVKGFLRNVEDDETPRLGGNLDTNGFDVGPVTETELGYLSGVTSSVQAQLNANANAITVNAGNIATNTSNIAANAAAILVNAGAIATNTANISTNTTNISTNTTNISTNTTNIATNTSDIATNAAAILTKIGAVVDDTSPQLGEDLDTNAFDIQFDDLKGIRDDSDNETLIFGKTASAVNHAKLSNAATGTGPTLEAVGDDANVPLNLRRKGTAQVGLDPIDSAVSETNNTSVLSATWTAIKTLPAENAAYVVHTKTDGSDYHAVALITTTNAGFGVQAVLGAKVNNTMDIRVTGLVIEVFQPSGSTLNVSMRLLKIQ
jgi:hypothetical protein